MCCRATSASHRARKRSRRAPCTGRGRGRSGVSRMSSPTALGGASACRCVVGPWREWGHSAVHVAENYSAYRWARSVASSVYKLKWVRIRIRVHFIVIPADANLAILRCGRCSCRNRRNMRSPMGSRGFVTCWASAVGSTFARVA